jgi:hypothetical protein
MTTTDTRDEPTPIIKVFRNYCNSGYELLQRPNMQTGPLRRWSRMVRSQLSKIYGSNSAELDFFPIVDRDFPEHLRHDELRERLGHLERIVEGLEKLPSAVQSPQYGNRIFIGHGRSPLWRELKDFIAERLGLQWDEFNREAVAGYTTSDRLQAMLSQASFAFLIMTAEEEDSQARLHARPNVIHEVGLFQGCLGLNRAIVLLEDGCAEFSNIIGLSQIRFPKSDIAARFEDIRRVLEREKIL